MQLRLALVMLFCLTLCWPQAAPATPLFSSGPGPSLAHRMRRLVKYEGLKIRSVLYNRLAPVIGYLELAGLRFPVKPYQAQVSKQMRRGSRPSVSDVIELKNQGYKSIISLTAEKLPRERETAMSLGMNHVYIPIIDNTTPTLPQMKQFLDLVTKPQNQPVYVHCEAGKGRTGMAVAVTRMAVDRWPLGKAMAEAQSYGLKLRSQKSFIRQFAKALEAGQIPGYPRVALAKSPGLDL
jgi:protein-tyrosine phosphatase